MQYANDITPLTLASTAELRELISNPFANSTMKAAMVREIESRIPGNSILDKNSDIEELETELEETKEELENAEGDAEIAEKKLEKIGDLIESGEDYSKEDIKEIIG